ncbi:MAG: hypothetical protein JNM85_03350 [Chthonomonas sp.]|nr:hypothetical protein [Chthonomonas sp.]
MSPEQAVVGEWTGTDIGANLTINFSQDKKWSGSTQMGSASSPMNGTWSMSERVVTMKFESINGQPATEYINVLERVQKSMPQKSKELDTALKAFKEGARMTLSDDMKTLADLDDPKKKLSKVENKS